MFSRRVFIGQLVGGFFIALFPRQARIRELEEDAAIAQKIIEGQQEQIRNLSKEVDVRNDAIHALRKANEEAFVILEKGKTVCWSAFVAEDLRKVFKNDMLSWRPSRYDAEVQEAQECAKSWKMQYMLYVIEKLRRRHKLLYNVILTFRSAEICKGFDSWPDVYKSREAMRVLTWIIKEWKQIGEDLEHRIT